MNVTSQFRQVLSVSRLARAYDRFKRSRANARASRTSTRLDARTLRDIGISRSHLAGLTVPSGRR